MLDTVLKLLNIVKKRLAPLRKLFRLVSQAGYGLEQTAYVITMSDDALRLCATRFTAFMTSQNVDCKVFTTR